MRATGLGEIEEGSKEGKSEEGETEEGEKAARKEVREEERERATGACGRKVVVASREVHLVW